MHVNSPSWAPAALCHLGLQYTVTLMGGKGSIQVLMHGLPMCRSGGGTSQLESSFSGWTVTLTTSDHLHAAHLLQTPGPLVRDVPLRILMSCTCLKQ